VRNIASPDIDLLRQYRLSTPEFLQIKTKDKNILEAMMIKPPHFDPQKKYPVLCYVYGGPQHPVVRNIWGRNESFWHQMMAQKGYIIWMCDNRTCSGKGVKSVWPLYRNFGELELKDIEEGLGWLREQKFVDSSRIGIWGWSFGGYLTSYALTHSKSFKMGISVAPVTDWHNYDSIYTERYMGLPQNNQEGYKKSSVVLTAKNIHGILLLVHGTMDDNVHIANTLQLAYALQKAGKQFGLMLYPRSMHGIEDVVLRKHLFTLMTNFVVKNL
jgi:dipeptidyl-peptidase-4